MHQPAGRPGQDTVTATGSGNHRHRQRDGPGGISPAASKPDSESCSSQPEWAIFELEISCVQVAQHDDGSIQGLAKIAQQLKLPVSLSHLDSHSGQMTNRVIITRMSSNLKS